jgi:hypothetical protein
MARSARSELLELERDRPVLAERMTALEAVVRELVEEVRALRLDRVHVHEELSRADRALLSRLLPAVAGAHGSDPVTARELVDADAAAAVRVVTRGRNARQLGRLFQRAEGQVVDGFVVARAGVELGVVLWRVLASPGSGNLSTPPDVVADTV